MKELSMKKQFLKFVVPAMLTMLLNGLYTIVDGFFIGHAVGDMGLAGIGLVWPITAVLIALGMGIGVGGSVLMSTYRGAGDNEKANEARANMFIILIIASIIVTILLVILNPVIVKSLGAKGEVYYQSISYIKIIAIGGSMQIISSGLIPLIRNNHQTIQAMLIMGSGLICNIFLDAYLTMVVPMGVAGAALATIISQTLTVIGCIFCLCNQKTNKIKTSQFKFNKYMVVSMLKIGVSPFGLSLMPSMITVLNNFQCLNYGGDLAVSAYAVINYFLASALLILEGIGEGLQPLISYYNGAGNYSMIKKLRNWGFASIIFISTIFLIISAPAKSLLPRLFATSPETTNIIKTALPILSMAFPMMGIAKLFTSYFYACGETISSTLLVYSDPIIFTPICIIVLPKIWELNGVWMSLPGAQILSMLLLTVLFIKNTIHLNAIQYSKPYNNV